MFWKEKILIIEDDRDVLHALRVRLRGEGYQVAVSREAGAAIVSAVEGEPDLILLDLGLPDGDGLAVLERLQAIVATATIPVIIITARDLSYATKAFEKGALAFLEKPVDDRELLAAIELALETRAGVSK
jgi:two-component system KDP operon response regulator KdpE